MKILSNQDFNQNELQNAVLQPLASAPSSPVEGQMYFNTTSDKPFIYANGAWLDMGQQGTGTGATNLSTQVAPTTVTVISDTGNDAVIPAADATNAGVMTNAMASKLAGIETNADVTTSAKVNAAGAVMNSDVSTADMGFVIDEDTMASNSETKVPTQQSVKAYTDTRIASLVSSSPETLDTLQELAAALGNDPNFATSIANSIGLKLDKAANLSDVANSATAFNNIKQNATASATGVVELATVAETTAKSDTARAVTPAGLASFARKATGTIGDGSLTSIPVTHGLGTQYVTAQLFDATTGDLVQSDVRITSATVVTFIFSVPPTTNQYRYVIVG